VLRKDVKLELLRQVPLFAGCSRRELEQVAAIADELELPAGQTLTREGAAGREFVVLVDGAASVTQAGKKIATLAGGEFAGEIALLTGRPRTATVTTTAPSRLLVITARGFRALLRDQPGLQLKMLAAVAARLSDD